MDISKITGTDKVLNTGNTKAHSRADVRDIDDRVSITPEAKRMAEMQKAFEIVKNTPDVRAEKIEHAKQLIASGEYSNKEVLDKVVERLLQNLGS